MSITMFQPFFRLFNGGKVKFTIKTKSFGGLHEAAQNNPIRYTILKEIAENSFEMQGPQMKCTDYFNDVVARHKNPTESFEAYGFKNVITFEPDGGLWVLIEHITKGFEHNLTIINDQLKKDIGAIVMIAKDDIPSRCILYFPKELFCSTYVMSLFMWLLRLSNYGLTFTSWDDIWTNNSSPANGSEGLGKGPAIKKSAKERGFLVPEAYTKYWWFQGSTYNSEKNPKQGGTMMHNCGCAAWWQYMTT